MIAEKKEAEASSAGMHFALHRVQRCSGEMIDERKDLAVPGSGVHDGLCDGCMRGIDNSGWWRHGCGSCVEELRC
ncbi:UNVERIFIED_ORG: hypothetical protein ABIC43_007405 [Variovorax guangxiensis]